MNIYQLIATQRVLKRPEQIPEFVEFIKSGGIFNREPLIEIKSPEEDLFLLNNGHHRVTAILLAGRDFLYEDEFILTYESQYHRPYYKPLYQMEFYTELLTPNKNL